MMKCYKRKKYNVEGVQEGATFWKQNMLPWNASIEYHSTSLPQ